MRVLQVIPAMTAAAGAEASLHAMAPYLLESGTDLHLAVLTGQQDLVPDLRRRGVVVHDLSGRHPVRQIPVLASLVRKVRPDLVHASLVQAALPSQLVGRLLGVPVLVTWASTPIDRTTTDIAGWKLDVVRAVEAAAAAISRSRFHAVSAGVAATKCEELRVASDRVRVAERGRDPARYIRPPAEQRTATRRAVGVESADFVFLAVGRQEPDKGYEDLLRIFDAVATEHERARLLIAGSPGTATDRLEKASRDLVMGQRVTFLGHRDDVPQLMSAADAVVCASHREGAAGALIEAMAVQVPIVSVELDGLTGVLADGENATVVPRPRLADAMELMMTDERAAAERAERARRLFEERFTIERAAQQLHSVYLWAAAPGAAGQTTA